MERKTIIELYDGTVIGQQKRTNILANVFNIKEKVEKEISFSLIESVGKVLGTDRIVARVDYHSIKIFFTKNEITKEVTFWSDKTITTGPRVKLDDITILFNAIQELQKKNK